MNKRDPLGPPIRWALALAAVVVLLTGCGAKPAPPKPAPGAQTPVELILTTWQKGEPDAAVQAFLAADWTASPLFAPGTPLSLREADVPAMAEAERDAMLKEITVQLGRVKDVTAAVREYARTAGNKDDARRACAQLEAFGNALGRPEHLTIVQLVGRATAKAAAAESAKLGQ